MDTEINYVSVDQLPDDPLQMPPPYWRAGGAWFQLDDALEALKQLLPQLPPILEAVDSALHLHYEKYPTEAESETDVAMEEFGDICDPLWEIEHQIKMKCDLACLMSAILAEETINMFCVFNLPKEFVEAIEKLSPAEKLTSAANFLGERRVRATAAFSAVSELFSWRNAYAHGHCIDRPVKTLRHNHLISPNAFPGVPDCMATAGKLVTGYVKIARYLRGISRNEYTKNDTGEEHFAASLRKVQRYKFSGNSYVYKVRITGG